MKCYVLEQGQSFAGDMEKSEISAELEQEILALCLVWQARDLHQEGRNPDDYESEKLYEALDAENFFVSMGRVVVYFANHFRSAMYVPFPIEDGKFSLGDYDYSDYRNNGPIDRGHVAIVPKPDTDTNPYHDEARFHSQEEYEDYIKWRD